ncbi:MAG: hypothetical protein NVS3B10_22790 [Polyangiales bacterium]
MALGVGVPLVVALAFASLSRTPVHAEGMHELPSISKLVGISPSAASAPPHATLAGLELSKLTLGDASATAPLPERRVAHLTIDPALQRAADASGT